VSDSEDSDEESMTDTEEHAEDDAEDIFSRTKDPLMGYSLSPNTSEVDETPVVIEDEEARQPTSLAAEMIRYHCNFIQETSITRQTRTQKG
jgi:hypothetical protein